MAKPTLTFLRLISRLVKGLVGFLLIFPVAGFSLAIYRQLETTAAWGAPSSKWFVWGMSSYIGLHLLFYKPKALFRFNHTLLARLAVWLFGGQVATVDSARLNAAKAPAKAKGKPSTSQGSTLVVLSPYLVPLYVVLVSVIYRFVVRGFGSEPLKALAIWLIGAGLAFHLAMTAEDLQQDRDRFPLEIHLMALAISSLANLMISSLCLGLAIPGFSVSGVFAEAIASTRSLYTNVLTTLFF